MDDGSVTTSPEEEGAKETRSEVEAGPVSDAPVSDTGPAADTGQKSPPATERSARPPDPSVRPLPWDLDGALRRTDNSVLALAGIIGLWIFVFGLLVWRRHDRFASFGLDMAIFDQALWLLSRFGSQFMSIRGLDVFGHHASFAFYLLVPFYWLGAGPHFVNLLQVVTLAMGAVPIFLLARHRLDDKWMALLLAGAFLAHPAMGFLAWELFHPETIAITFLLFAYWFAIRERWKWFAVMAVVAVLWKEDVALTVLVLGLLIAWRGNRRVGLLTAGLALGWFLFVTRLLLPTISGSHAFYLSFFSDLGDSPSEIIANLILHPSRLSRRVFADDAESYMWKMTAPFGFTPLAAPAVLLVGIPQALVNLISVNNFTRTINYHYAALPLTGLVLGMVEGIAAAARKRPAAKGILVGFTLASSLAATLAWGLSPIGHEYRRGWWPHGVDPRRQAKEAALAMLPDNAGVSATYLFTAHLTHREKIYEFPNPFRPSNWGVQNENPADENNAEYLVIDTQLLGAEDRQLFDENINSGEYQIRFNRDGIIVAQRVQKAPPRQQPPGARP